jgi:hypothetical protein
MAAATALMTLALVGLSRVPWSAAPGEDGALRLAWQYRSQPIERCRAATPEELAKLPQHMRRSTICERGLRPYVLEVSVDGGAAHADTVRARGARADRPLGVFAQVPLAPGAHAVRVTFTPLGGGHAPLALDTTLIVARRQVWLVTLDAGGGALELRERLPAAN